MFVCLDVCVCVAGSFSSVFVDQSFWQGSIASKPAHGVAGLITGGLAWFAIPFCAAFAFGMQYWAMALDEGQHTVPSDKLAGQSSFGQHIIYFARFICVVM